jgi:hypothetical protein
MIRDYQFCVIFREVHRPMVAAEVLNNWVQGVVVFNAEYLVFWHVATNTVDLLSLFHFLLELLAPRKVFFPINIERLFEYRRPDQGGIIEAGLGVFSLVINQRYGCYDLVLRVALFFLIYQINYGIFLFLHFIWWQLGLIWLYCYHTFIAWLLHSRR